MTTQVNYSENNSGGYYRLSDADYLALARAGWAVSGKRSAMRVGLTLDQAKDEWERTTGKSARDPGCDCCGRPHDFYETKAEPAPVAPPEPPPAADRSKDIAKLTMALSRAESELEEAYKQARQSRRIAESMGRGGYTSEDTADIDARLSRAVGAIGRATLLTQQAITRSKAL